MEHWANALKHEINDVAAFYFLSLDWVFIVLQKVSLDMEVIRHPKNLYSRSKTIVIVNNIPGKAVDNLQSMHFFSFVIDPLLLSSLLYPLWNQFKMANSNSFPVKSGTNG